MLRTFIALLALATMAFANSPSVLLNEANDTVHTGTPTYKAGWCDPTGAPGSNWNNGLAFYAAYTAQWPSFNATFYNMIDLAEFGETAPVDVEELEIAIMNRSGTDGVNDLVILPDDGSGYPDNAGYLDVQEDVGAGWTSGTYPDANWNNFTYTTPVATTGDEFWIAMHEYWPSSFNFYIAMEYLPADGGLALYDAAIAYVQDGFETISEMGYASGGAWGLKCYVVDAVGVESASLGEIKAVYK